MSSGPDEVGEWQRYCDEHEDLTPQEWIEEQAEEITRLRQQIAHLRGELQRQKEQLFYANQQHMEDIKDMGREMREEIQEARMAGNYE